MNHSDPSLARLLRAAGQYHPAAAAEEPPFGFTTRVIAAWIAGAGLESSLQAMWFRRAFLCALAIMALSVGWSFKADTTAPTDEMAIASYDTTADLP